MKSDYLFVYGTLQAKADNEMSRFLLSNAKVVDKGYFNGKLYKVSWFPGAILSAAITDKVYGTVFKLRSIPDAFKILDQYEGFYENDTVSSLFVRQQIEVFLENGSRINAWVYLYNQKITNEPQIISGDFLKDANT
ncbi:gamma-glutamylcyclotransferase family protein [Hyunsoonleella pacifica]|uniref:Gamma-glutamylcyclotransferase n=1 Tax=Hyunsoonleella pacifica TaxID=1080224 RepID=A0A4Q9FK70_9FLAO|nr:gamma-glutamylcyclotransferase family protein [Hyunsoonleella pacifica]TBN13785.1 gamma-glutamylcyclotransferase [Hyunsoonleella pacifica]GGD25632.1 gamma-glutamylcyclotransferase [Hyunsoonleella pacifica]